MSMDVNRSFMMMLVFPDSFEKLRAVFRANNIILDLEDLELYYEVCNRISKNMRDQAVVCRDIICWHRKRVSSPFRSITGNNKKVLSYVDVTYISSAILDRTNKYDSGGERPTFLFPVKSSSSATLYCNRFYDEFL